MVLDAGLMFQMTRQPGIDHSFARLHLCENEDKLRGILIFHSHERSHWCSSVPAYGSSRKVPIYSK